MDSRDDLYEASGLTGYRSPTISVTMVAAKKTHKGFQRRATERFGTYRPALVLVSSLGRNRWPR